MSLARHKTPHKGPVLSLCWSSSLSVESRVDVGEGAACRLADVLKQLSVGQRVMLLRQQGLKADWLDEAVEGVRQERFELHERELPDGEAGKALECLTGIWKALQEGHFDRSDAIVAVGGGALSDVAGFAASTYMRGLKLVLLPTTLLSQVDAAIGGKTAINLSGGKNLAGTFYFPQAVLADPLVLATLPRRQFVSGLSEVMKYALIEATVAQATEYEMGPRPLFDVLEECLGADFDFDSPLLPGIITVCIKMKLHVVAEDPREASLRRVLNFGHTLGHAIEKVSRYQVTHGEAISAGMMFALRLGERKGLIGNADVERVERLFRRLELPVAVPAGLAASELAAAMALDKKKQGTRIKFVLPGAGLGLVDFDADVELEELTSTL